MTELTETQAALEEIRLMLADEFSVFADAEMNFDEAVEFLLESLTKISVKEECTRITSLYWAVAALLLLEQLSDVNLQLNFQEILEDPLALHFSGEEPHVLPIYGASLLRYAFGIVLTAEKRAIIAKTLATLYDRKECGFRATEFGELDTRTTYAALCAIFLNEITEFAQDYEKIRDFFMKRLDFGFSGSEGGERHASYTFCALAGLNILKKLGCEWSLSALEEARLLKFLVFRQQESGGFNGRINKLEDGCYNFWVGASLSLMNAQELVDIEEFNRWVSVCNEDFVYGGFRDKPGVVSDRFHNCYVLTGWWLMNSKPNVDPCFPILKQ